MTATPLVSVLVPTYNHREFVTECLDSIFAQEFTDFEVIVSDDASTDGARDVLADYAAREPDRLRVLLAEDRGGVTVNCNRAWRECRGRYVAITSGDDLMRPQKLARQVELMESDPECAVCYHDLDVFESSDRRTLFHWNAHRDHKPREGGVGALIEHGTFIGACSGMVRRENCPEYGFDEAIPVASDWLFLIEAAARGGSLRYIPAVLGGHRRHTHNVTRVDRGLDEQFRTLDIVESRYPALASSVRRGRGRLYYAQAVEALGRGASAEARRSLAASVRHGWISWKTAVRWLQSFGP